MSKDVSDVSQSNYTCVKSIWCHVMNSLKLSDKCLLRFPKCFEQQRFASNKSRRIQIRKPNTFQIVMMIIVTLLIVAMIYYTFLQQIKHLLRQKLRYSRKTQAELGQQLCCFRGEQHNAALKQPQKQIRKLQTKTTAQDFGKH